MKSKEKAIELVKKCSRHACMGRFECKYERHENAKKLALIAVDEILIASIPYFDELDAYVIYWQQVKREILALRKR